MSRTLFFAQSGLPLSREEVLDHAAAQLAQAHPPEGRDDVQLEELLVAHDRARPDLRLYGGKPAGRVLGQGDLAVR